MEYIPIAEIKIGSTLDQIFYISSITGKLTKAGKPYAILTIKDTSGTAEIKIWGLDLSKNPELKAKCWIKLKCSPKEFRGKVDITTENMPMVVPQPDDISLYVTQKGLTIEQIEVHWSYLKNVISSIENLYLKKYLEIMFGENSYLLPKFKNGAASFSNRGAFKGGLISHYAKVMKHALALADLQEKTEHGTNKVDRELIIVGVMAHDIAKALVYNVSDLEVTDTRARRLIDHLAMSYAISTHTWIAVESELRKEVPEDLKDLVNHIILSHHGAPSYGSPVKPQFLEAYIVHIADMMDSSTTNYNEQSKSDQTDDLGFAPGNFITGKLYVSHLNDKH